MTKDQKRRGSRRKNNNERADAQDSNFIVKRRETALQDLREDHVFEFQGQPVFVRDAVSDGDHGISLSLSRALEVPTEDKQVKCGRSSASHYEDWYFVTRSISAVTKVDRFYRVQRDSTEAPTVKRRKRAQASDRMGAEL